MLNEVSILLCEAGLVRPGEAIDYNVLVSYGDTITIDLRASASGWFHCKVSRSISLQSQYEASERAYAQFGRFVPRPLLYRACGPWDVLVVELCKHRPVRRSEFFNNRTSRQLCEEVGLFLGLAGDRGGEAGECSASREVFMRSLWEYFDRSVGNSDEVRDYLARIPTGLLSRCSVEPQHGDFVLNNLGHGVDQLLVFDFEDFGLVDFQGLDLFTMCLSIGSMTERCAVALYRGGETTGPESSLARLGCRAINLDPMVFRELVPIYLLVFRFLKRDYGADVKIMLDRLIAAVLPLAR